MELMKSYIYTDTAFCSVSDTYSIVILHFGSY